MTRTEAQDVYRWKATYKDGSVKFDDIIKDDVVKIELLPLKEGLTKISLVIDGDKKPIFFTRRYCKILGDKIYRYDNKYFLGYSLHNHIYLYSVDSLGRGRIEIDGDINFTPSR